MYVNCQGALAIEIWPGIFILKNLKVHQNQKNGAKQPNGYILSAYLKNSREVRKLNDFYEFTLCRHVTTSTCIETLPRINIRARDFEFLPPYFQVSNTTISTSPVCANIIILFLFNSRKIT